MKLKLDENLGVRGQRLLAEAGHEACTVSEQGLTSSSDEELAARCAEEGRALVTLDLDFANPLRFPPGLFHGIAVLRGPARLDAASLDRLVETLIRALKDEPLDGRLWIVEDGRIRVYQPRTGAA